MPDPQPQYLHDLPMSLSEDKNGYVVTAGAIADAIFREQPGWFLLEARHDHTPIIYKGETHQPVTSQEGAWCVEFQKLPHGGLRTAARGHTLASAWSNAVAAVARRTP